MAEDSSVQLSRSGGDVKLEVIVTNQKPAGISVALYGSDRQKERDLGAALTLEPPDPDVFNIAQQPDIAGLNGKFVGIFVSIGSTDASSDQPVAVITTLRQGGATVTNGTLRAPRVVKNGGAGAILAYEISVV